VTEPFRLVVETGSGALASARERWRDLADRSPAGYFQTWEWVTAWHEILEPQARILLVEAVTSDDRWAGLLPLAFLSRRMHRRVPVGLPYLGFAGSGPGAGDHLGPLASSPQLVPALVGEAIRRAEGRSIYLESLDPELEEAVNTLVRGRRVHRVACPAIDLRGLSGPEEAWTAKVRKNVRRRDRRLADEGITGRWVPPGADLRHELGALQEVHLSRWRSRGEPGLFDDRRLGFLRRLAELSRPPEGPGLYLLERGPGHVVAALLVFRHGRTLSTYKTGWDPAQARLGLGIALHTAAMRKAWADGMETFDFLRGQGGHKYSLGAVDRCDVCLLRPSGPSGALFGMRERGAERHTRATSRSH